MYHINTFQVPRFFSKARCVYLDIFCWYLSSMLFGTPIQMCQTKLLLKGYISNRFFCEDFSSVNQIEKIKLLLTWSFKDEVGHLVGIQYRFFWIITNILSFESIKLRISWIWLSPINKLEKYHHSRC